MSFSAALVLAAAAAAPVPQAEPSRGVVLADARVTAQILSAVIVRQASGLQRGNDAPPRAQISRRGNTILAEFQ